MRRAACARTNQSRPSLASCDISAATVHRILKDNTDYIEQHHSRQISSLTRSHQGLLALARDIAITATPQAVNAIIDNLRHPDPRIRNEAAKTLITMNLTGSTAEKLIFPTTDEPRSHETSEKTALVLAEAVKLMLEAPAPPALPTIPPLPEHVSRIRGGQPETTIELDAAAVEILPPIDEPSPSPTPKNQRMGEISTIEMGVGGLRVTIDEDE